MKYFYLALVCLLCLSSSLAQTGILEVCPNNGILPRPAQFEPSGIILTSFDSAGLWVYDIGRNTRYPLPQTTPCTYSCHPSPDFRWISYLDPETLVYTKMRFSGLERTPLVADASDVRWWSPDTLLIWTIDHRAYLRPEANPQAEPQYLNVEGVQSIQPTGYWALAIRYENDEFVRYLVNLQDETQAYRLAPERAYFNTSAWSPSGHALAYVGRGALDDTIGIAGGELYLAYPNSAIPEQMTFLTRTYGAVRINGFGINDLSWSPDSRYLAFWLIELTGADPVANTDKAVIHLLDTQTREIRRYCGFSTTEHTPNTPRLVWSPDGTHIAFAGNVPQDDKGVLLLALNIATGEFTELSNGIFPAPHIPDVTAWGNP